jgi:hypothetical protein
MNNDPADEHVKTVYAHYGVALYFAQCLEHGLANALVYVDLIPRSARAARTSDQWTTEFDAFMGRSFEQTLGRLIRDLRLATAVPQDLEDQLTLALKRRNWLAHNYFRERASQFMSAGGRDDMIQELEEAQALFQRVDDLLGQAVKPVREKYGLTDDKLEKFYADHRSKIETDL